MTLNDPNCLSVFEMAAGLFLLTLVFTSKKVGADFGRGIFFDFFWDGWSVGKMSLDSGVWRYA